MTLQLQAWETTLVSWAHSAQKTHPPAEHPITADGQSLIAAYHYCEEITRQHSRTFFIASGLLPPEKRRAARALYAFCRITDNLVDEAEEDTAADQLTQWRRLALHPHPPAYERVALAWADTRARFHIPHGYAEQLIDGVARDLTQSRYACFDDLAEYAYGVASTVGLMAMHIIGYTDEDAVPYAIKLGVALQLTNILRDIGEDWTRGRLYLPQDELAAFGLDETIVGDGQPDPRWNALMRFQIDRARRLYAEAWPGIGLLNADGRFAIAAAADLYGAILDQIERNQFDVFSQRAHLSALGKVRLLPGIWWRSRGV
jgi:15-cis-phytoene synthase